MPVGHGPRVNYGHVSANERRSGFLQVSSRLPCLRGRLSNSPCSLAPPSA